MSWLISFERCQSSCQQHGTSEHYKTILSMVGFDPPTPHKSTVITTRPQLTWYDRELNVHEVYIHVYTIHLISRCIERERKIMLKAFKGVCTSFNCMTSCMFHRSCSLKICACWTPMINVQLFLKLKCILIHLRLHKSVLQYPECLFLHSIKSFEI